MDYALPTLPLLDHLPVGLTFADEEGIIRYYNDFIAVYFERSAELIGQPLDGCHNNRSRQMISDMYEQFRKGRKTPYIFPGEKEGSSYLTFYLPVFEDERFIGCLEVLLHYHHWLNALQKNPADFMGLAAEKKEMK